MELKETVKEKKEEKDKTVIFVKGKACIPDDCLPDDMAIFTVTVCGDKCVTYELEWFMRMEASSYYFSRDKDRRRTIRELFGAKYLAKPRCDSKIVPLNKDDVELYIGDRFVVLAWTVCGFDDGRLTFDIYKVVTRYEEDNVESLYSLGWGVG